MEASKVSNASNVSKTNKTTKFECKEHYYITSDSYCKDCQREIHDRKQRKLLRLNARVMEILDNVTLNRDQLKLAVSDVLLLKD